VANTAKNNPTETLQFALAERVIRHPEQWFGDAKVEIAIRSALEESSPATRKNSSQWNPKNIISLTAQKSLGIQ
jgi:hypothetical protein